MPTTDWVIQAAIQWIGTTANLFLPEALLVYHAISVVVIIMIGGYWVFAHHHHHGAMGYTFRALGTIFVVGFILNFYNTPSSLLGGYSFHQFLPEFGRWTAQQISSSAMQNCMNELDKLSAGPDMPTAPFHPIETLMYYTMLALIWLLQGVLFLLSSVWIIFVAVGILLGPLSLMCFMIPLRWANQIGWSWMGYMLSWSFAPVVAAAIVDIWSNIILFCLGQAFHGNYKGIELLVVIKMMVVLTLAAYWTAIYGWPRIASALYGSAVGGAEGFSSYLRGKV